MLRKKGNVQLISKTTNLDAATMKVLMVIIFLIGSVAESLKLYNVHVPHFKFAGEKASLECDFDLGGTRLYAVKWYKDNEEFFSYVARFKPSIRTHKVEGVNVAIEESDQKGVFLKDLDSRSTGVYRCEVSAEAPTFLSVHGEGRMTVVHLPKEGPQITGTLQVEYQAGDILDLNCSSSKSFPPAKITWFLNDLPVKSPFATTSSSSTPDMYDLDDEDEYALTITSLRLRIKLLPEHFGSRGKIKVRCVASISTLFWEERDERIIGLNSASSSFNRNNNNNINNNNNQNQNHSGSKKMTTLTSSDNLRFGSPTSTSTSSRYVNNRHHDSPTPFIFNSTAIVTVYGGAPAYLKPSSGRTMTVLIATLPILAKKFGLILN